MINAEVTQPGEIFLPNEEEDTQKPSVSGTRYVYSNGIYIPAEFVEIKKE